MSAISIFPDHLNTRTKLLPVSRGYYFIPGGKGQRLPLPLCISGQHKSVFHDLFCSIANSPLQSLTFLYPSLYLSVGDLVCLGDCVRRSKHLTRLKLPNLKSIESYMPILLAVGGSNAIQTLRIDSNTVSVWDKAFQLAVTSLRHNSTLRTLSLAHWTFDLQTQLHPSHTLSRTLDLRFAGDRENGSVEEGLRKRECVKECKIVCENV
ncbi:hypothetical protein Pcinc_025352 [Petrolisthes cinctipes]|uniref:Uncharacterized protein n=1 Tax=Petrolisthes cinctipes TaxID=88211 RepID=A0AAE1F8P4_PETCI|nr:hypothetical protein Pcinc_025352 [Petrolisthes cinctipes]